MSPAKRLKALPNPTRKQARTAWDDFEKDLKANIGPDAKSKTVYAIREMLQSPTKLTAKGLKDLAEKYSTNLNGATFEIIDDLMEKYHYAQQMLANAKSKDALKQGQSHLRTTAEERKEDRHHKKFESIANQGYHGVDKNIVNL